MPIFKSFSEQTTALSWTEKIGYPVFIKPIDSSGSRGVSIIRKKHNFKQKFDMAMNYSSSKKNNY